MGGKDGIIFHGLTNYNCSFASMKHFADNNQRAFQIDNSSCKNIQGVVMEHDPPNTALPAIQQNGCRLIVSLQKHTNPK